MTRKVDPLDTALGAADVPKVPDGLASRIVLDVTRLAQEQPVVEGTAAPDQKPARTSLAGKRRIAACAAAFAAIAGLAAYSLAGSPVSHQQTLIAGGTDAGQIEAGPAPSALSGQQSELAVRDGPQDKAGLSSPAQARTLAAAQEVEPQGVVEPTELDAQAVQELAMPTLLNPLEPYPEPALATHSKATQGPALEDGSGGSASVYGPPGGEGMGIVGGAPNIPAPRGGGAKNMGPPPPPR